ncbi:MAG: GvpL/GvpF family gas vesicle protein, partial [Methanothrix sp.]|nr:GvpL/GvpF family gas vesicle protein [Methanothrix sp.]
GMGYLLQKKLDARLKSLASQKAAELTNLTLGKIKTLAAELKTDDKKRKADSYKGMTLLVSYICLVADENVLQLGETLDEINRREGFRVRFTGPWAPFSFVDYRELS